MTKDECLKKIDSMMVDVINYIPNEVKRLIASGGIDLDSYENNHEAPKILLAVALKNCHHQYTPLYQPGRGTMENLDHFYN